jgi:hypothetical protein
VPRRQRLAAWITCLTVAACSIGVPLPARSQRHAAGDPYPCQNCPCGCSDAETCWRNCCCHTNIEKLAWARRNGMKPPAFVIAAARRELRQSDRQLACCKAKPPGAASVATQCSKCAPGSVCGDEAKHCKKASAACSRCAEKQPVVMPSSRGSQRPVGVVLLAAKLRCSGISLSVSLLPPSVVPSSPALEFLAAEHFQQWPGAPLLYESPYLAISPPPPDLRCA